MMKRIGLILKIIIIIVIISFPLAAVRICYGVSNYYADKLAMELLNDPALLNVEKFVNSGRLLRYSHTYTFRIFFDGGRMIVNNIKPFGNSDDDRPLIISQIDNYHTTIYDENGEYYDPVLDLWSALIEVPLESIIDVVKNYHAISKHVSNWINMIDHRENDDELFIDVLRRITLENLYTATLIYRGQELVLLKYPTAMRWAYPKTE